MLSVTMLASKKLMIMHYITELIASKKENDTNYWFEIFYAQGAIVTLKSAKTTLLPGLRSWSSKKIKDLELEPITFKMP